MSKKKTNPVRPNKQSKLSQADSENRQVPHTDALKSDRGFDFILIALVHLVRQLKSKNKIQNTDYVFFIIVFLVSGFLLIDNNITKKIWDLSQIKDLIQFPWRLLSLMIFSIAYLLAHVYDKIGYKIAKIILFLIVLAQVVNAQRFVVPEKYEPYDDMYYLTNDGSTTTKNEFLPIWVKEPMANRPDEMINFVNSDGQEEEYEYKVLKDTSQKLVLDIKNQSNSS